MSESAAENRSRQAAAAPRGGPRGTLPVIDLAEGGETLRYDADNALANLAAAADSGFWAVDGSGRLLRLDPPRIA